MIDDFYKSHLIVHGEIFRLYRHLSKILFTHETVPSTAVVLVPRSRRLMSFFSPWNSDGCDIGEQVDSTSRLVIPIKTISVNKLLVYFFFNSKVAIDDLGVYSDG